MPFYHELNRTFEFSNDLYTIICGSMGELIRTTKLIAGIDLLPLLN